MAAPLGSILRGSTTQPLTQVCINQAPRTRLLTPPPPLLCITSTLHIFPHHLPVLLFSSHLRCLSASCFFFYQASTSSPHHPKSPDKPTSAALYSPPSPPLSLLYSGWQRRVRPISRALLSLLSLFSRDIVYICPANHRQSLSRPHRCCNNTGGLAGLTLGLIWGVVLTVEACQLL